MAPARERRSAHDPGVVARDLAVSIDDGGDCVTDLGVLRGQQALCGPVASETTAHQVVKSIDGDLPSYAGSTVTSTADNGGSRLVGAPDRNSSYASRSEASEESHVSISADHDLRLPGTARAGFGTRERRMASPTSNRGRTSRNGREPTAAGIRAPPRGRHRTGGCFLKAIPEAP
jgi:hypothetical protein